MNSGSGSSSTSNDHGNKRSNSAIGVSSGVSDLSVKMNKAQKKKNKSHLGGSVERKVQDTPTSSSTSNDQSNSASNEANNSEPDSDDEETTPPVKKTKSNNEEEQATMFLGQMLKQFLEQGMFNRIKAGPFNNASSNMDTEDESISQRSSSRSILSSSPIRRTDPVDSFTGVNKGVQQLVKGFIKLKSVEKNVLLAWTKSFERSIDTHR